QQVVSWEFSDLCPGRIAAYDANRLLVLDAITGSLAYIAWSPGEATPSLYRITKPSEHLRIELICTTFRRRPGIEQLDQNDLGQLAYFTANVLFSIVRFFAVISRAASFRTASAVTINSPL
ncbi:unnamed protein product, partial [Protopolystoma xenopodis]